MLSVLLNELIADLLEFAIKKARGMRFEARSSTLVTPDVVIVS